MRLAIFLFLMLMTCSKLFAYGVNVTKLTDENFDPLPKEIMGFYMESVEEYPEKQIATITLRFEFNEIGKDYDAVAKLAKKEAAKLGANKIIFISHLEYENTVLRE